MVSRAIYEAGINKVIIIIIKNNPVSPLHATRENQMNKNASKAGFFFN